MAHARSGPVDGEKLTEDTLKGAQIYGENGVLFAEVASLQGKGPYANVIVQTEGFLGRRHEESSYGDCGRREFATS